jgi:hypothetical protein
LATRFGQEIGTGILFQRALPLWMLGYPQAAVADCDQAMRDARDLGLATTLMPALLGRFKWSSQRLMRSYDDQMEASLRSFR